MCLICFVLKDYLLSGVTLSFQLTDVYNLQNTRNHTAVDTDGKVSEDSFIQVDDLYL